MFDQQSVIKDESAGRTGHLLVGKVRVGDTRHSPLVSPAKDFVKFSAGDVDASRHDQCGVAEVDDPDLASAIDFPSVV